MDKKCEICGEPIGPIPASTAIFNIRPADEPDRKPDLCLGCITRAIEQGTQKMKEARDESE